MKKICILSVVFLLVLQCTNRHNPVSSRNNPGDSGGTNFIENGSPTIKARIDSLVWYDYDHAAGLGTIRMVYSATDPNLPHDSISCRFFLSAATETKREIFAQPDSTLLLNSLKPKSTYRCSLSVVDSSGSPNMFVLTFGTPVLIPPLAPVPSIAAVGDTVKISWKSVAAASGYRIYSADSLTGQFTLAASIEQPTKAVGVQMMYPFIFEQPGSKYYIVASFNQGGECRFRDTLHGIIMSRQITPPTIESISKGTYRKYIQVAWHANDASTTGFEIYRSVNDTFSYKMIKHVAAQAGQNTYIDSVIATGNHYYKIAAINQQGYSSYLSASDYGYILRLANATTLTLDATSRYIGLYWNPVTGASGYIVYRNSISCSEKSTPIDTTSLLFLNDTVVSTGDYYYSVAAMDNMGTVGPLSNCVTGSLGTLPGPKGLQINNKIRLNALTLTWDTLAGAKSYSVFRSTTGCPDLTSSVYGTTTAATFVDTAVITTVTYYYTVSATDDRGRAGSMSTCSNGSANRLSSPMNFVASNGIYAEYVSLSWDALPGAVSYVVFRSSVSCWESKVKIASPATTAIIDSVPTSNMYYYTVAGIDASGTEGSPSACMQGWVKPLPAPANPMASYGEFTAGIRLTWEAVAGATGYIVYSGMSSSVNSASVRATTTSPVFFDSTKTTSTVYYWVAATNRLGAGTRSSYAYGSILSPPVLSISRYTNAVVLSWYLASGKMIMAYVRRSSDGSAFTVIDSSNGSTYSYNPPDFNNYYYQVSVRTPGGSTSLSNTVAGYKLLSPPTGLFPTDQKTTCFLQWNRASGAAKYYVYRSETSFDWKVVGTVTDTFYADPLSSAIRYYYRVSAVNPDQESSASEYVIGGILETPAIPAPVRARSTSDAITIIWGLPSGSSVPTGYYIHRQNNQTGKYELLDSTTATSYTDSVKDSATYYYRIAAFNQVGASQLSDAVFAKLQPPLPPTISSVSSGTYSAYVRITWKKAAGIDSYGIYRNTSSGGTYAKIGNSADTLYFDTSAVPNTRYYYRVSSIRKSIEGSTSSQLSGIRLGPPTNLQATPQFNGIYLSWSLTTVKVRMFYIYRGATATGTFTKIDSSTVSSYLDTNETAGINYYRISASNLDESPQSIVTSGVQRPFPLTPDSVMATQGTDTLKITVTWDTVPGAQGYRIYRSMSDSFTTTTLLGTSKICRFADTVPSDSFYYYRVKTYNISGESSLSLTTARGFRASRVVPDAPLELDTLYSTSRVSLVWKMPSRTVAYSGFKIYRATSETGTFTLINETTGFTYRDTPELTFPNVYWYRVTAVNKKGESAVSNVVSGARQ